MSPEEKKLDKLNALFEMINEDYATPDDLIQLSEALLSIVTTEKERVNSLVEDSKGKIKKELEQTQSLLSEKEQGLKTIIARLASETDKAISDVDSKLTTTLSKEIKRLEKKIPTKTDVSGLEADIKALSDGLNSLPTEITVNGEAVRDSLELLRDEERLDKSAIKGLDEYDEIVALARSPKTIGNAGVKLLRYLQDVNIEGITNGQTILWNSTLQRFEPGSGGTGGGHTIQDEGTPLTQRTNLNFIGGNVTVTDNAGADSTDVTISGAGLADGDKGDVTVSASGATWTIDNDVVTYAKMQNVSATDRILGRDTAGAGDIEEITPAALRTMINVADGATAYTDEQAQDATGTMAANSTFVSLAYNDATPSLTPSLSATGTPDATKFLRGDNTWATPAGSGDMVLASTQTNSGLKTFLDGTFGLRNVANTFTALFTNAITAARTYTWPDASGTVALTSDLHSAVTVTDSAEINFTLAGQDITANIIAGSIDETKLDVSTNASLDLADSASQPGHTHTAANVTDFTEAAQDAVGAMVDASLTYVDGTPLLQRAALTGAVTATAGSNATSLGSFTLAALNTAVSDANIIPEAGGTFTGDISVPDEVYGVGWNGNLEAPTKNALYDKIETISGGATTNINTVYVDQSGGTSDTYGVLAGTINGSNAVFTVSQAAYGTGTLKVYLNGQLLTQGTGEDWTETTPASGTFTFVTAPATNSLITVEYQKVTTSAATVMYGRQIINTSGSATVASAANTDYVYFVTGLHTMSLSAASGNTNRYTFKNNHSAAVTIDTVGVETIDGTASIQIAPEESVDIISNQTNYYVV